MHTILTVACANRQCLLEIATGAKRPRNDKSGAISILTIVCSGRQRTAGSGMPLPYKIEKSRQETRRDAAGQKNRPSRKFRREEKCERKPSGCPFAFNHPPQRQNCKIMLQNLILQFWKQLGEKAPEGLFLTSRSQLCDFDGAENREDSGKMMAVV